MKDFPEIGKPTGDFLEGTVFPSLGAERDDVLEGPGYGVDCALVDLSDGRCMAVTSDPTSFMPVFGIKESAWLSVILTANDCATSGVPAQFAQFVLNLPGNIQSPDFERYWNFISQYCKELGIAIIGGHTGRVEGQNSTVSGGVTMFSFGSKDEMVTTRQAGVGNDIIFVGSAAHSASCILARAFPERTGELIGEEHLEVVKGEIFDLDVVAVAKDVAAFRKRHGGVTSMHDVTEGGAMGAIYELGEASNTNPKVEQDKIPLKEEYRSICEGFSIDPYFTLSAGALVITCEKDKSEELVKYLKERTEKPVSICGTIEERKSKEQSIVHPGVDPYWDAFYKALRHNVK